MKLHRTSLLLGATGGALIMSIVTAFGLGARPTEAQEDLRLAVQKSQVMAVTYQLDNSGFHDLDVKLNNGEFVAGALGRVRKARIATQTAMWPHEMQETARKLVGEFQELETALRNEDVAAAAPRAKEMHELYHGLSDAVYTWLSTGQSAAPTHGH
ncbi:MAG: hypothetical protein ACKVVP_03175 [Chloroflexota bacterium]